VVKQTLWVCSNNVDYFCWLSEGQIKVFDLSLNMYSKVIELSEFDSTVSAIAVVKKADREECYLVGLGSVNILFYDIGNAKIERIEVAGRAELYPFFYLGSLWAMRNWRWSWTVASTSWLANSSSLSSSDSIGLIL
jgi:hypothetical protein